MAVLGWIFVIAMLFGVAITLEQKRELQRLYVEQRQLAEARTRALNRMTISAELSRQEAAELKREVTRLDIVVGDKNREIIHWKLEAKKK